MSTPVLVLVLAEIERRRNLARRDSEGKDLLEPIFAANAAVADELEELRDFILKMDGGGA